LEDLFVGGGRYIKMVVGVVGWEGMDQIGLAEGGNQWQALVNTALNLRFHKMLGIS